MDLTTWIIIIFSVLILISLLLSFSLIMDNVFLRKKRQKELYILSTATTQANEEFKRELFVELENYNKKINELNVKLENVNKNLDDRMIVLAQKGFKTTEKINNKLNILSAEIYQINKLVGGEVRPELEVGKETTLQLKENISNFSKTLSKEEINIPIIEIKGIGPKTKEYLNRENIFYVKDLIELVKSDKNLNELVYNWPGLKNETIDQKIIKFNKIISQAQKFIERNRKAN